MMFNGATPHALEVSHLGDTTDPIQNLSDSNMDASQIGQH